MTIRRHGMQGYPGATKACRYMAWSAGWMALALAFPCAAQSYTLGQLLDLTLERLLELKFTAREAAPMAGQRSATPAGRAADGGDHAP